MIVYKYIYIYIYTPKRSLEIKLPPMRTNKECKRREKQKKEDQRRKGVRRKKSDAGKSRNNFCSMICGSGGSKSGLAKAAVRSHLAKSNCTPLWREAHVQVRS